MSTGDKYITAHTDAATIARLSAEVERLRGALTEIDSMGKAYEGIVEHARDPANTVRWLLHYARAALAPQPPQADATGGEGWIACSKEMPTKDAGYWVLGWNGREVAPIHWDLNEYAKNPKPRWTKNDWAVYRGDPITHWRPLPSPPPASGTGEKL